MMYSGVWLPAMFERSGPTGLAPIAPALWQARQAPLPVNTAWPAFGSPGSSIAAAPPRLGGRHLRDVVELDVHGPAEALEVGHHRPQLAPVQPDRRLRHVRHDVGEALDDERARA